MSRLVLLVLAVVCCGCGASGRAGSAPSSARPVVRCEREWASAIGRAHGDVRVARALFTDYRRCGAIGG